MDVFQKSHQRSCIFYLSMQMFVDEFQEQHLQLQYRPGNATPRLTHARIYNACRIPDQSQVTLITAEAFTEDLSKLPNASFIVLGKSLFSDRCLCSAVFIHTDIMFSDLLDIVQNVFDKGFRWAGQIQDALIYDRGPDEICRISKAYFNNPVFFHDSQFYILGSSGWIQGMSEWDRDKLTGRFMISSSLINHFKTDPEYINTFYNHGAHIYTGNFRDFRCAYVILWNENGGYEGHLCINEVLSPLKAGQLHAMEYLACILMALMQKRTMRPFEQFLSNLLDGHIEDRFSYDVLLSRQGWAQKDQYFCMKLSSCGNGFGSRFIASTCNQLRMEFNGASVFPYKENILAVLNLTVLGKSVKDCLSQMAPLVREGLLKVGASNEFSDLSFLPRYYTQAELALAYGERMDSTKWCVQFLDIALFYCARQACNELEPRDICAPDLIRLRDYDRENDTNLYDTLNVYLQNDRNAAKSAPLLYIHRSTLFYRLNKIRELIDLNLDNSDDQLYLRFSFYMMEHFDKSPSPSA